MGISIERKRRASAVALVVAALALAGCSGGAANEVIAPVIVDLSGADGTMVEVSLDNVVDLNAGDTDPADWSGEIADPQIAEFVPGGTEGDAVFNPGLTPLAVGETEVTVTNSATSDAVTFTLHVTE